MADYFEDSSPYSYADNNPILNNDPLGLMNEKPKTTLPEVVVYSTPHKHHEQEQTVATSTPTIPSAPTSLPTGSASTPSTTPTPVASTPLPPVNINYGPDANQGAVTQHTITVLQDIMRTSDNTHLTITSTQRSPEAQARAMYNNIQSLGVQHNLDLYGASGDQVVRVAQQGINQGLNRSQVLANMTVAIRRVGPGRVSRHSRDPNVLNVIDISPASLQNRRRFVEQVRARGIFLLQPPADPAYHLEIRQ